MTDATPDKETKEKQKAWKKMREDTNDATLASSAALQDDALTEAEEPIDTKLDG